MLWPNFLVSHHLREIDKVDEEELINQKEGKPRYA